MKNQACEFLHQPVLVNRGDIPALEGPLVGGGTWREIVGDLGVQALTSCSPVGRGTWVGLILTV